MLSMIKTAMQRKPTVATVRLLAVKRVAGWESLETFATVATVVIQVLAKYGFEMPSAEARVGDVSITSPKRKAGMG